MPHESREKRIEYNKKYLEKNKDELNRKRRERYANDDEYRQKRKESDKLYYDKVKRNKDYQKEFYAKNKDRDKEYKKKYAINNWIVRRKKRGIIFTDEPIVWYNKYINATNCDFCNKEYKKNEKKCLEHHHASGTIRGICCHTCNMNIGVIDKNKLSVFMELNRYFFRN